MRVLCIPFGAVAAFAVMFGLSAGTAMAQPAAPSPAVPIADDMPLDDYLGLLTQIAPASHDGARAYLQAFQQRCGRPLKTAELRRAMSDGDGDPVLMAMIRASHLRDVNTLTQLGQRVTCDRRSAR
jgi:hypothetical protein